MSKYIKYEFIVLYGIYIYYFQISLTTLCSGFSECQPPCTFNLIQTELYSNYMVAVAIAED